MVRVKNMKESNLYVGVNSCSQRGEEYFKLSSNVLEFDEDIRFETREQAEHIASTVSRAYHRGRRDAKRTLLNWLNE